MMQAIMQEAIEAVKTVVKVMLEALQESRIPAASIRHIGTTETIEPQVDRLSLKQHTFNLAA